MGKLQEQLLDAMARNDALEHAQLARKAEPAPAGLRDYVSEWQTQIAATLPKKGA